MELTTDTERDVVFLQESHHFFLFFLTIQHLLKQIQNCFKMIRIKEPQQVHECGL